MAQVTFNPLRNISLSRIGQKLAMAAPRVFRNVTFPRLTSLRRVVDIGANEDQMVKGAPDAARLSQTDAEFLRWLFDKHSLSVEAYRPETLARRLPACLRLLRVANALQAREALEQQPALISQAISVVLIGVTSFARDTTVFDLLRTNVLPSLAEGRKGLYCWSAGCSTGEELYSLAFLLAESKLLADSYLLGTDCRADAIEHARRGEYAPAVMNALPLDIRRRYFEREDHTWRVAFDVRRNVRWRTADILRVREPGLWDLIAFRNAAIYMRPDATKPLWAALEASLRVGGVLVLGKAERPCGAHKLAPIGPCLYRKIRR